MATLNLLLLLLLLLISLKGCNQPHRRTDHPHPPLTLVSLQAKGKKKKEEEEEAPKLPYPYLEENTMGMEEIFAHFDKGNIFPRLWVWLCRRILDFPTIRYASVCVRVWFWREEGGGKMDHAMRIARRKGKKKFFLPFLFLSPRAKPNSWEEKRKKPLFLHVRLLTNKV